MEESILLIYLFCALALLALESLAFKVHHLITKKHYKEHHYTFRKYLFFLTFPLVGSMLLVYNKGWTALSVFTSFAVIGTLMEWLVGWSYYNIVGQRLWTYHRYSITKYTSFLSVPLWGFAGLLFWLLAGAFN